VLENLVRVGGGLELGERDYAEVAVEAPLVEQVDRFRGVMLQVVEPGPLGADWLGPWRSLRDSGPALPWTSPLEQPTNASAPARSRRSVWQTAGYLPPRWACRSRPWDCPRGGRDGDLPGVEGAEWSSGFPAAGHEGVSSITPDPHHFWN
jgi:hypothetical protein